MWDVVVAGGGPAGAVAALTLARAGRRVLLVDRESAGGVPRFKAGEGLPPAARRLLRDLGLLERFETEGHLRALGNQSAWGSDALETHDFLRDPDGCGWHLDRPRFDAALRRAADEAGAQWRPETRLAEVTRESDGWNLGLVAADGTNSTVRGRWLIDAGGRGSHLASAVGADRQVHDRLVAFVALCRGSPQGDPDAMTLLEAAADGWWYTARLPGQRRVVAFHTDADLEAARQARQAEGFKTLLDTTRHVAGRLAAGGWTLDADSLHGAPAASVCRKPFAGPGWLAAGDAAAAFDPLSSQGILTALYGGLKAGRAVDGALADKTPEGTAARRAVDAYATDLGRVAAAYLGHRRAYYRAERRWRGHLFWDRRRG